MGQPRGHCYIDFLDSQRLILNLSLKGAQVLGEGLGIGWLRPGRPEDPRVPGHGARHGAMILAP